MGGDRIRLGLTGDVGSGKSSLRRWLTAAGAATLDADDVAREVLERPAIARQVITRFGSGVADEGGGIDRAALARRVFDDPPALARLESIMHPPIARTVGDWLERQGAGLAVVEAVKLVESGMYLDLDRTWLVICAPSERRRRLRDRGWDDAEIQRRMRAATPLAPRLAAADAVIDNSGPWSHTERQLRALWRQLAIGCDAEGRVVLSL